MSGRDKRNGEKEHKARRWKDGGGCFRASRKGCLRRSIFRKGLCEASSVSTGRKSVSGKGPLRAEALQRDHAGVWVGEQQVEWLETSSQGGGWQGTGEAGRNPRPVTGIFLYL